MKKIYISILLLGLCIYPIVIGFNENIESSSSGNIVLFPTKERAKLAENLSTSFHYKELKIQLNGIYSGKGNLNDKEVNFEVKITGSYRRKLFDPKKYEDLPQNELKSLIETHLKNYTKNSKVRVTELSIKI